MSDSTRKRCRKSKLVPRDCALLEEEEINLQTPLKKPSLPAKKNDTNVQKKKPEVKIERECDISVLQKIKAAVRQNSEPKRTFEVAIQIETYDEEMNAVFKLENNKTLLRKHLKNLDETPLPNVAFTAKDILKATDKIFKTSTNTADKILSMYVKNSIGLLVKDATPRTRHQDLIQNALEDWKAWSTHSKHVNRTPPVFYKCYICKKAWWHLSQFKDHIVQHKIVTIRFERSTHEANIIASLGKKMYFEDIFAEGNCSLCGKDYDHHKVSREKDLTGQYEMENACRQTFFNCYSKMIHSSSCEICSTGNYECPICSGNFEELKELDEHLVFCHSVRSDVPAAIVSKKCRCSGWYVSRIDHVCGDRGPVLQCSDCHENFYNKAMLQNHLEASEERYNCEICNEDVDKSCMKYIHLMSHTDKFMMVSKCMQCPNFTIFVDEQDEFRHKGLKHGYQDLNRQLSFTKTIIPVSCVVDRLRPLLVNKIKEEISDSQDYSTENGDAIPSPLIDIKMENESDGEEPADREDEEQEETDEEYSLVIKEEPLDTNETYSNMFDESTTENEISIKEENLDDDDYQGDIIKIDANFEHTNDFGLRNDESNKAKVITFLNESDNETSDPVLVGGRMRNRIYKCNKCGYRARHKKFKEHVETDCGNSTFNKKSYHCSKCETIFPSLAKYLMHFTKHGFKELSCPDCCRQFQTHTQLGQHIYSHVKQNFVRVKLICHESYAKSDFQCKQCSEIVIVDNFFDHWQMHLNDKPDDRMRSLEEMRQDVHAGGISDHVPLPGCMSEADVKECLQHIMMKVPKQCIYCQRKFTRVYGCKRHIIEHLLTDAYAQKPAFGTLRCQICATGFPSPEKYKQHMRDHASLPVYKCELCDRTFSDSSNFTKHKKVHNYKVVVCDLCGKKFQAKSSLVKHLVKHEISAPITCNLCNKIFYFESSYRRHIRYTHEKVTFGFRCVICNERFDCLKNKWDHMWDVHKERKQKADCPICLESFRKYADVKTHAKIVHGMEVSVLSMKNASNSTMNLDKYFKSPKLRLGENETLVVYDSE